MTARKPPEEHKKGGRPRKDDFTRDPGPAASGLPLPEPPPGDNPEIFHAAGLGVPLADIAAGLGLKLKDLLEGGEFYDVVRRGIFAYGLDVARAAHRKARSLTGNPIPGVHWLKCRAAWRETGEREIEKKKERTIRRVTLRVIHGGMSVSPGGGEPLTGGGPDTADSGVHAAALALDSPDSGAPRGPRRDEVLAPGRHAAGQAGHESGPVSGVPARSTRNS